MDKELITSIRDRMAAKPTEELREIYGAHDHAEWTPEAFEAIRQVLSERGEVVAPYEAADKYLSAATEVHQPGRWPRWVVLGVFLLGVIALLDYFVIFPIGRAKSGLAKGDEFVARGNLPDAAHAYATVLVQYPWFTKSEQYEASRRILTLFASMKPGDAPAIRDALTLVLRANKLGPQPLVERSEPTAVLLYFDNGLDRAVDVFVNGQLAQSVPAKSLRKYAYHVNGPLRIETRESGKPTVVESFETQFTPAVIPCTEPRGCKGLFVSGGVPPAQYLYNIASKYSYRLQFRLYRPAEQGLSLVLDPLTSDFARASSRIDPELGSERFFFVPLSVDYMLDEPVPTKIEIPQDWKTADRGSLVRH